MFLRWKGNPQKRRKRENVGGREEGRKERKLRVEQEGHHYEVMLDWPRLQGGGPQASPRGFSALGKKEFKSKSFRERGKDLLSTEIRKLLLHEIVVSPPR